MGFWGEELWDFGVKNCGKDLLGIYELPDPN